MGRRHHWLRWMGAAAALAAATPASATWRRAESANFLLYSQADEADVRQDAALLEDYWALLRALTGVQDPPAAKKLSVYVVRYHEDLEVVHPGAGGDTVGVYDAAPGGIAAFAQSMKGLGGNLGHEVLFHEIAHHFMLQYRPLAYPLWYVEGFAEFVQTATFDPDKIEYGKPSRMRGGWLIYEHWLPLGEILLNKAPNDEAGNALFYAESWLLTHYLLRDPARRAKLAQYLVATAGGEDSMAAFRRIFGMDPSAMQKDMAEYTHKGFGFSRMYRANGADRPAAAVTTLPASADDLLLLDAALKVGVPKMRASAVLGRIRSAARKYNDDYSLRVLAEAEALIGDPEAAGRALEPLIAAHPDDPELLYWEGMRHLLAARRGGDGAAKERRQAQIWLAKSHRADPDRYQTLYAYAESLSGDPQFLSENTTNVLLLGHALAPQVSEITLNAARVLLLRDKFDQAIVLLTPLASVPHDRETAAAARALLDLARARKKPEAAPFTASGKPS
jgi:hypothetical protein